MSVLLEARPYRPFKSSEEYLIAMKEDLAEWLNTLYPELRMNLDNFMDRLDTGVAICKHANNVRRAATDYVARRQARKIMTRSITSSLAMPMSQLADVAFLPNAKAGTFFARDNVSNFISWCRNSLGIIDCLLFESDDLIMRKNERHVILCLLEVARRGAKFGMLAPMLVQMERQIDREIAAENKASNGSGNDESDDDYEEMQPAETCLIYGPQPQIVTNDLKSLDEMVRDLVEKCTCPTQFPMIRVSEGKYRIGDTKVLIFVRILRSHVMVRVGGGWDTLSHYLDKHDPCRCRTSHRSMISAKLIQKAGGSFDLSNAQVHYERSPPRTRRSSASSVGSCAGTVQLQQQHQPQILQTPRNISINRSRSPTPNQTTRQHLGDDLNQSGKRSRSPTPHTKESPFHQSSDLGTKQRSRSPTPKVEAKSGRDSPLDATRKALNEEIRHIKYDNRTQMYHSRHQDHYQDPKKDLHQEIREKVPLSEEFSKRYIVEGGVARRTCDKEDTPKYEPTIYNYKCGRVDSSSPSPTPSPPTIKEEAVESFAKDVCHYSKPGHDGEHSDNGSEVSDEGYRSLGAVQPSVIISNGAALITTTSSITAATDIANNQGLTTVVECQKQPSSRMESERSCVETDSIETGLRKTKISPMSPMRSSVSQSIVGPTSERTLRANSIVRESSNLSRGSSSGSRTPREGNSSPEGSPLKRNAVRNSMKKLPPGGTIGAGGTVNKVSAVPRCYQNYSTNGSNTWNGRQSKQRAGLSTDTFVNPSGASANLNGNVSRASPTSFTRKNSMRQSLPKTSSITAIQYDKNGRRVKPTTSTSLQSSPTKIANPLLEQILQKVGHLQDDKQVVQKLQDFLRDYQSHDSESEANLEFTRAWIDGNGTVALPHDVNPITSPRKDPKTSGERSGGFSRIPTPIYKRAMSVASDNI